LTARAALGGPGRASSLGRRGPRRERQRRSGVARGPRPNTVARAHSTQVSRNRFGGATGSFPHGLPVRWPTVARIVEVVGQFSNGGADPFVAGLGGNHAPSH